MTSFDQCVPAPTGRFDGIERPYSAQDVLRLRGSVPVEHSLARRGSLRLWELLTQDEPVRALRKRQMKNLLATLLLSQGTPMLLAGDEFARTQRGNNNAYCQDNEISWFDWEHADRDLLTFVQRAIAMRRAHPVLRRRRYLADPGYSVWFAPDGRAMTPAMWQDPARHSVAVFVDGSVAPDNDRWGEPLLDRNLLVLVNGAADAVEFRLPDTSPSGVTPDVWHLELDSSLPGPSAEPGSPTLVRAGDTVLAPGRSLLVHWSVDSPVSEPAVQPAR